MKFKTIPLNKVANIIKMPRRERYRHKWSTRRRGPAFAICCHRLKYPLRTLNKKFETIPVYNVPNTIKIPNIGRCRYIGALRRRGPAKVIFCHKLKYPLRSSNTKFKTVPLNNVVNIIKIPKKGRYRYMWVIRRREPS